MAVWSIIANSPLKFMDYDVSRYIYETYFRHIGSNKNLVQEFQNYVNQYLQSRKVDEVSDYTIRMLQQVPLRLGEKDSLSKFISNRYGRYTRSSFNDISVNSYYRSRIFQNQVFLHSERLRKNQISVDPSKQLTYPDFILKFSPPPQQAELKDKKEPDNTSLSKSIEYEDSVEYSYLWTDDEDLDGWTDDDDNLSNDDDELRTFVNETM